MTDDLSIKQQVREFYDQTGWQSAGVGVYQNARYEDLRPVSADYIHKCHLRVGRHLPREGRFVLDAGSGPIQYPEYLTYSRDFTFRVCLDLSIVALREARARLGGRGLYVVADVSRLPFRSGVFQAEVSLHTLHHVPGEEQKRAFQELYRTLAPGAKAVVVNGWTRSPLMQFFNPLVLLIERFSRGARVPQKAVEETRTSAKPVGTFIHKFEPFWLKRELAGEIPFKILVWRSVNVRFLRAVIHSKTGGVVLLKMLYWLEERLPLFLGEKGQYPLIVLKKQLNTAGEVSPVGG